MKVHYAISCYDKFTGYIVQINTQENVYFHGLIRKGDAGRMFKKDIVAKWSLKRKKLKL